MIIKRVLGVIIVLTAVLGLAVCVGVIVLGQRVFDRVAADVDGSLSMFSSTLDTVSETLQLAQETSTQVSTGLHTAEVSLLDTARTISETRPLVSGTGEILTVDAAKSIDAVQANIPVLANLAGSVDKTLTFLSKAQILGIGLGIDYNPSMPLDQSINDLGKSFDGIPAKLRSMSGQIDTANRNLDTMSSNLQSIGLDLHAINTNLARYSDLFARYQGTATAAKQRLLATQTELRNDLQAIKMGLVIFFIWLGLTQLAPLYIGIDLLIRPKTI